MEQMNSEVSASDFTILPYSELKFSVQVIIELRISSRSSRVILNIWFGALIAFIYCGVFSSYASRPEAKDISPLENYIQPFKPEIHRTLSTISSTVNTYISFSLPVSPIINNIQSNL